MGAWSVGAGEVNFLVRMGEREVGLDGRLTGRYGETGDELEV